MDPPQPLPSTAGGGGGGKLRLMCSYGGQIVPRPDGKTLCYAGGETRIVAFDRRAPSISALTSHLSRSLLGGRSFALKYQLPHDDLDSLISITTDEDLVNMIDEYDRLALSPTPSRLRFFLFPVTKSDANSGEYDARSEAWFFDSLRSARIDSGEKRSTGSCSGGESECKSGYVVDSGLGGSESIVLETNSSFGSTGSAASVSNLPAVTSSGGEEVGLVQVQDLKVTVPLVESIGSEGSSFTSSNFQSPTLVYLDSFDHHSDPKDSKIPPKLAGTETNHSDVSPPANLLNPMQAYGYSLPLPLDQLQQQALPMQQTLLKHQPQPTVQSYLQPPPQYIHPGSQYATQYYPAAVSAAGYPTTYHPYLHQQPQQTPYGINNPYPIYLMPVGQAQPHDISMQHSLAGTSVIPPAGPQMQSGPPMTMASKMVYDGFPTSQSTPELAATNVYRTGPVVPQPLPVPSEENKFMTIAQISLPPQTQPVAVSSVMEGAKYGAAAAAAEFDDPLHAQIYKTQPSAPAVPSQFQPMTNAATVMLSDNLSQLQLENTKQQVRT